MAIKYVRNKGTLEGGVQRYTPPSLFDSLRKMDARRRLFLIYLGMGGLLVAMLLAKVSADRLSSFEGQPTLRGVGVVVAKEPGEVLVLEVAGLQGRVQSDAEAWTHLNQGDRVAVLYQRSRNGRAIRIHEAGVVALPEHKE